VSGYGLDDRVIEVWSPAEAKDFSSSLCVLTSSEHHPMVTGGNARPGCDTDHSPPSNAEVKNEQELYSSPLCVCMAQRDSFTLLLTLS
jgi:hypothetical protein